MLWKELNHDHSEFPILGLTPYKLLCSLVWVCVYTVCAGYNLSHCYCFFTLLESAHVESGIIPVTQKNDAGGSLQVQSYHGLQSCKPAWPTEWDCLKQTKTSQGILAIFCGKYYYLMSVDTRKTCCRQWTKEHYSLVVFHLLHFFPSCYYPTHSKNIFLPLNVNIDTEKDIHTGGSQWC